ncbi:MAG TPA: hypothetical protein PKE12_03790 [Kiritimatiellia bacterium]|nr:hypothetical protein [Kiritimatiellia bacterium]
MHTQSSAGSRTDAPRAGCGGSCCSCGANAILPPSGPGDAVGGRLAAAALLVFVLPLIGAVAGTQLAGPGGTAQLSGAALGLFTGIVVAQGLVWLCGLARRAAT